MTAGEVEAFTQGPRGGGCGGATRVPIRGGGGGGGGGTKNGAVGALFAINTDVYNTDQKS